jgi:hypothetical protein
MFLHPESLAKYEGQRAILPLHGNATWIVQVRNFSIPLHMNINTLFYPLTSYLIAN